MTKINQIKMEHLTGNICLEEARCNYLEVMVNIHDESQTLEQLKKYLKVTQIENTCLIAGLGEIPPELDLHIYIPVGQIKKVINSTFTEVEYHWKTNLVIEHAGGGNNHVWGGFDEYNKSKQVILNNKGIGGFMIHDFEQINIQDEGEMECFVYGSDKINIKHEGLSTYHVGGVKEVTILNQGTGIFEIDNAHRLVVNNQKDGEIKINEVSIVNAVCVGEVLWKVSNVQDICFDYNGSKSVHFNTISPHMSFEHSGTGNVYLQDRLLHHGLHET